MTEKSAINKDSAEQQLLLNDRILVALLDCDLHFKQLMDKVHCSRGVLGTHLRELRKSGLVTWGEHDKNHRNGCCPHHLTDKGKKETREILSANIIRGLPNNALNLFMLSYKEMALHMVVETVIPAFFANCQEEKEQCLKKYYSTYREGRIEMIIAIERDLKKHGFNVFDIADLWLIQQGTMIANIITMFGAPEFISQLTTTRVNQPKLSQQKKDRLIKQFRSTTYEFDRPFFKKYFDSTNLFP